MGKIRKATIGERFWLLVTLGVWEIRREWTRTRRYEKCRCECWNIIFTPYTSLRSWHTQSCWCVRKIATPKKGTKFGRWTTLGEGEVRPIGTQWWRWRFEKCVCDCWEIRFVSYWLLKSWESLSCWCYHREKQKSVARRNFQTHGLTDARIYKIYRGMWARCNNPNRENYNRYWGRWIKCLWACFEDFYTDMYKSYENHVKQYWEDNTTIERINSDGNYCKENCRRATREEQANNTRQNRYVVYKWKKITISSFAKELGMDPKKLYAKLRGYKKDEILDLGLFRF